MIKKLFSPIFLAASILLLVYVLYKSEIIFSGTNREHYFEYYILCFILIISSIGTFYINKKIKEYLSIIILSIIFSAYSFEYYLGNSLMNKEELRILKIKKNKYKNKTGKKWDERSQYQVYRNLIKIDSNTVPYFYPTELNINSKKIHSLSGVSNSPTIFCNENGYYSISNSDRYGFNNPDDEWDSNEFEFVFVGDSFTHGYCVNRPKDIPSVVRGLSNKSTLNLGYGRNGPLIEYAVLREYLPKKTKNIVFMYYGGNDLANLNEELKNEILIEYLNNQKFNQNLKSLQNEIDYQARKHILSRSEGSKYQFYNLKLLREKLKNMIKSKEKEKEKEKYKLEKLEKILFLTKKLSTENQSKLYFVYLSSARYTASDKDPKDDLKYFMEVKSIVEKLEINFIDIHKKVFENKKNPLELFPFEISGHYNVKGYREVATAIYKHISIAE
jgi:lysophospholipase L1-like esterase